MESSFNRSPGNRIEAEKAVANGGAWKLMSFMLFVFGVFFLSYIGLTFGYQKLLSAKIAEVDGQISALAEQISQDDQDSFLRFQFQLINLKNLLANHKINSKLFTLIESNTNRSVQYKSFDLDTQDNRVSIRGNALSYPVFSEQLAAYDRMPEVTRYQVTNSTASESGVVDFSVTLFLSPTVFSSQ